MRMSQLGSAIAIAASPMFAACSSHPLPDPEPSEGSIAFELRAPRGVVIEAVAYVLNAPDGEAVRSGVISVPEDDAVIKTTLSALPAGDYSLALSAEGRQGNNPIDCASAPVPFTLEANQNVVIAPPLDLVCRRRPVGRDTSARVTFTANVTIEELRIVQRIVEQFGVAPISVVGEPGPQGDGCVYPPMALRVANETARIRYAWAAAPDGAFAFSDDARTNGTYTCESDGRKTITVTATRNHISASRTLPVTCASVCSEE